MSRPARRAFTLVEIVITVALGVAIVAVVGIAMTKFIQQRELELTTKTLVAYLRTAANRALGSEGGEPHGVSRANGQLTLFRGASYASRQTSYDTVFPYPNYVEFAGLTEAVFAEQTGLPSVSGDFTVSGGGKTNIVTVYSTGAISRQ